MPCDPNTLLEQAKCLNACIPQGMQAAVQTSLLCRIADAGGGGGGGEFVLKAGDTMTGPLVIDVETAGSSVTGLRVDIQDDPDDGAFAFVGRLWNGASFDITSSIAKDGRIFTDGGIDSEAAIHSDVAFTLGLIPDPLFNAQSIYASGTAYTLTNAIARVDFGTTDPTLLLTAVGTYRLKGRVLVNLVGATFAANQTLTVRLRNATSATDYTNSTTVYTIPIVTTLTNTLAVIELPEVFVALAVADQVQLFAGLSATPSAGSVQIVEASITAFRTSL